MTPFLVGVTTAYLANRRTTMSPGRTTLLVLAAAGLGTLGWFSWRSRASPASFLPPRSGRSSLPREERSAGAPP